MVPNIMQAFSLKPETGGDDGENVQVATFGGSQPDARAGGDDRDGRLVDQPLPLLNQRARGGSPRPQRRRQRLVAHVKHDWRTAPLSDADRAMLAYAEKITASPSSMTLDDLEQPARAFQRRADAGHRRNDSVSALLMGLRPVRVALSLAETARPSW